MWACRICTLDNNEKASKCEACKAPCPSKPPPLIRTDSFTLSDSCLKWKCLTCEQPNPPRINRCQFCGGLKRLSSKEKPIVPLPLPISGPPSSASTQWKCSRCTLLNETKIKTCTACRTPKPQDEKRISRKPGWSCLKCTFWNREISLKCEICGARVPQRFSSSKRRRSRSLSPGRRKKALDIGESILFIAGGKCHPGTIRAADSKYTIKSIDGKSYQVSEELVFRNPDIPRSPHWSVTDMPGWLITHKWTEHKSTQSDVARRKWQDMMSQCYIKKIEFVDPDFPPAPKSLGSQIEHAGRYEWSRLTDFRPRNGQWDVIGKESKSRIKSDDIIQGELGDCWFLSALAVLAERQSVLEALFVTTEFNKIGSYQIMFFKNGHWRSVTIDDKFPTHKWGGLAFSKTRGNLLWVPLIEKAYAKMYGSYSNIIGGNVNEALSDLTGAPCERIELDEVELDSELTFARLVSFRKSEFLMGASCGNSEAKQNRYKNVGLQMDHAYSILDVQLVENPGGKEALKLVKLRNPWGSFEWKGAWSDSSREWRDNPEIAKNLKYKNSNDGVFWMSYHDLLLYFRSIDVCKLRSNWQQRQIDCQWSHSGLHSEFMYEVVTSVRTWMTLSVIQPDMRGSKEGRKSKQPYRDVGLIMLQTSKLKPQDTSRHKIVTSIMPRRDKWVHVDGNASDDSHRYYIIPMSHDRDHPEKNFVLSLYSANPMLVRPHPMRKDFLRSALQDLIRNNGKSNLVYRDVQVITYVTKRSGIWIMAVNADPSMSFQITIKITKVQGLSSSRGSFGISATIPPLHKQILLNLSVKDSREGYGWRSEYSYRKLRGTVPINYPGPLSRDDVHHPTPL